MLSRKIIIKKLLLYTLLGLQVLRGRKVLEKWSCRPPWGMELGKDAQIGLILVGLTQLSLCKGAAVSGKKERRAVLNLVICHAASLALPHVFCYFIAGAALCLQRCS